MASGGLDYYKNHDWYDNAMVIYEYPLARRRGPRVLSGADHDQRRRRLFRVCSWATKAPSRCRKIRRCPPFIAKPARRPWDDLISKELHPRQSRAVRADADAAKVDVRETAQLAEFEIPVSFNKPPHMPHLENFFNAIRGKAKLNCPADEAFRSEYVIHKANEAIAAQKTHCHHARRKPKLERMIFEQPG